MKRILVTGSNGQLGKCLQDATEVLDPDMFIFVFVDRVQLDIAKKDLVEAYFFSNKFDYVINCAAYTTVDRAEEEVDKAFEVNADAVRFLAEESALQGAILIHLSTDYVFDGKGNNPFGEDHPTNPINVYGKSKLEGERLAMLSNPNSIVIRTAWVYSQYGNNFFKTMLKLFKKRNELSVVDDQIGTPTNANDLARAIIKIIITEKTKAGIYHYTNAGKASWYEFALEIKLLTNSNVKIHPIPTSSYPTPAARPNYSVLNTQKIQKTYDVAVPEWKESLKRLIAINLY